MKVSGKAMTGLNKSAQAKELLSKEADAKKAAKDAKSAAKNAATDPAQVNLSTRAKQIKKATEIAKDDKVDEAKIARFQNLIDSGKYQVDAAKVADKLIDEHLKLPT